MFRKLIRNKYFLIFFALMAWLTFFDANNFLYQYRLGKEIRTLQTEADFYRTEIAKLKEQKEALNTDKRQLEKYAREHYLMKKADEDLFLIREPK
ncbi:MAG: septum formation initiator family protein [Flavobacteriales bacterium]|nr:septum formation initiator family protein [Bacteroidota bacterium]MCB9240026.1 septum formation initiator family protein [Flavobacteriales bacterium]